MIKIGNTNINPTKIVCLGRNYLDHIRETNARVPIEPVFFVKTLNTLVTDDKPIIYPKILYESQIYNRVDHEVELAFVIFQTCKNISVDNAFDYIQGYTIFLDLTARIMQKSDRNINLSEINDPHNLTIQLKLNGQTKQFSNTKHMLFKIPQILEYLSKFVTLQRGDIIATGTPSGIGPIQPGDVLEASIEEIGTITHEVILERE